MDDCFQAWSQSANDLASCQCGANHIWLNAVIHFPLSRA
jgi:hypothetical protein